MQIRNIKGIAERLKGIIAQGYCTKENESKEMDSTLMIACEDAILSTDLDINECAEVDVPQVIKNLPMIIQGVKVPFVVAERIANEIAKSGCIKWKEGGKE